MLLVCVVLVALANERMAAHVSFSGWPLRAFLGLYVVCLVGAALSVGLGVRHPLYLLFNWSETALLTVGVGLLIVIGGTAHSLLWLIYFSTVLHGARAAIYRRFNTTLFGVAPLVIAGGFLWRGDRPDAVLSIGLGIAALALHRLFLAAADQQHALAVDRDRLRQRVADLAVVEERERIARDLHDGFGASLNAAIWQARRSAESPEIAAIEHRLMGCLDELGALVWAAHRADRDLGSFWSHLRARCNDLFGGEVAVTYALPADDADTATLDDRVAVAAMYIVFEALRNSVRHARASHAFVTGRASADEVSIEIRDDGIGFDPEAASRGHGLAHMRDRARGIGGALAIRSRAGETIITARFPAARLS